MQADPESLRSYRAEEHLLDGNSVRIRAIRPSDKQALADGLQHLSLESSYFRFFRPKHDLDARELAFYTEVDFDRHVALVLELADSTPVGVARYIRLADAGVPTAEVAFAVDDAHQGLGVGTLLLKHLAIIARAAGIREFSARVLGDNHRMLEVFAHSGLPERRAREGAEIDVRLSLGN